jgi:hypothetical protein
MAFLTGEERFAVDADVAVVGEVAVVEELVPSA